MRFRLDEELTSISTSMVLSISSKTKTNIRGSGFYKNERDDV